MYARSDACSMLYILYRDFAKTCWRTGVFSNSLWPFVIVMNAREVWGEWPQTPGSAFIKPDQRNPWIKDQLGNALLSTISHLQLPNCVLCGRDKPSHMTQNLVSVGAKL